MDAINAQNPPVHPTRPDITGCHHVYLKAPGSTAQHSRHAMAISPGWFDRSPCGTGTSARMAQLHARGELAVGEEFVNESFIGSRFRAGSPRPPTVGDLPGHHSPDHRPGLDHRHRPVHVGSDRPVPGRLLAVSAPADVVVVGAGAVGAACAYFAARQGMRVHVVERGQIAGGTTSACEGNLLVSDKEAGPELDLALYSPRRLREAIWPNTDHLWEFEAKGGLVVAATESGADALAGLTTRQRASGIEVTNLERRQLRDYEPHISPALAGRCVLPAGRPGAADADDRAICSGWPVTSAPWCRPNTAVTGILHRGDRVTGVADLGRRDQRGGRDQRGRHLGRQPWPSWRECTLPILPRRGFVLVTEPLPLTIHHKVYAGEYVANVLSSDEGLQTSPVVESTASGTVLIGSSRERVGFDRTVSLPVLAQLAAKAIALFPMLASVKVMRSYLGFRPVLPRPPAGHRTTTRELPGSGTPVDTKAPGSDCPSGRPSCSPRRWPGSRPTWTCPRSPRIGSTGPRDRRSA